MKRHFYWLLVLLLAALLMGRVLNAPMEPGEAETIRQANNFGGWLTILFHHPLQAWQGGVIEAYWNDQEQHPSVPKMLFLVPMMICGDVLGEVTACRMGALAFLLLAAWALKQLVWISGGGEIAVCASLLALASPNILHHAALATVYFPFATLWWVAVVCWMRRLEWRFGRVLFCIAFAILFGTKINALQLLVILAVWHFWTRQSFRGMRNWIGPALAGAAAYLLVWPWLWPNPIGQLWRHTAYHGKPGLHAFNSLITPETMPWILIPPLAFLLGTPIHHFLLAWWGTRRRDSDTETGTRAVPHLDSLLWLTALLPCLLIPLAISGEAEASRYLVVSYMAVGYLAGRGVTRLLNTRGRRRCYIAGLLLVLYMVVMAGLSGPAFRFNLAGGGVKKAEAASGTKELSPHRLDT